MTRKPLIATALFATGILLAGCTTATAVPTITPSDETTIVPTSTGITTTGDLSPVEIMAANADYTTVNLDEWNEADAVGIQLAGSTASTSAAGVTVDGSTVTIMAAGVYRLSGVLAGQVVVEAPDDALVVLILDGVDITNSAGAAIEVRSADDVAIHLAGGSQNSVTDAAAYPDGVDANAAIYSEEDLTISGSGSLTVTARYNDGITSKDDLVILDGMITVTAADDALRGKDSLVVEGGTLTLTALGGDGLKSDGDEGKDEIDWTRGYIYIAGGTIDVTAADDGLQAFTDTVIAGGTVTVAAADDAVKAEVVVSIGEIAGLTAPVVIVTASTEGIEAASVGIGGGTVKVTASDDGINASGNAELQALINGTSATNGNEFADSGERLEISGGTVTVDAEGDGLDSNGTLTISGGTLVVYGPTRGGNGSLDSNGTMSITGGTVLAFGPGSMEQTPDSGDQGWVLVSARLAAGQSGAITDAAGTVLVEFTAAKAATTVIFSSADVETGASYTVTSGGQSLGSAVAGQGGMGGMRGPGGRPGTPGTPPTQAP